jgi:ubiquitin carboxyl-terminal hydrolase 5/13
MRQQDAFELLQHLIKLITRSQHPSGLGDPTQAMRFVMEQRLQCLGCKKVRYSSTEQDSIFIDVPLEKLPAEEGQEPKYKPVNLKECLDNLTAPETVELTCSSCGSKDGFTKRQLFKTFPEVLVVNARKMAVVNWVPVKVDVPVLVGDEPFPLDSYLSTGQQPDEEALPEEAAASNVPAFVPNQEAFAMLEAMGFPKVRCEKALHATGNTDANAAMEWLFGHMDDPDIDAPLDLGGGGGAAYTADPEKLVMLESMGLGGPRATKALKETNGDVERAIEWLFSHPDDEGDAEEAADAGEGANKGAAEAGSSALPANFQLQSIVCHKGTSIHTG